MPALSGQTVLDSCPDPLHVQVYSQPSYRAMVEACISQDLSWRKPALKWEAVLDELLHVRALTCIMYTSRALATVKKKATRPDSHS